MDNIGLAIVLAIALIAIVVCNYFWLRYTKELLKDARSERWELYERVREPSGKAMPPGLIEAEENAKKQLEANGIQIRSDSAINAEPAVKDEWDAVGAIDPPLPLRAKDGPSPGDTE